MKRLLMSCSQLLSASRKDKKRPVVNRMRVNSEVSLNFSGRTPKKEEQNGLNDAFSCNESEW